MRIMSVTWSAGSSFVPISKFVTGLLRCCLSHSSMAERSYTLPSSAMTGSTGSEKVMGQRSLFMASLFGRALVCRVHRPAQSSLQQEFDWPLLLGLS